MLGYPIFYCNEIFIEFLVDSHVQKHEKEILTWPKTGLFFSPQNSKGALKPCIPQ